MYLLDNNICIALLKENRNAIKQFNLYFSQCYLSAIIVSELYKGIYCSKQVDKNLEAVTEFIELLPVESFDLGDINPTKSTNKKPNTSKRNAGFLS